MKIKNELKNILQENYRNEIKNANLSLLRHEILSSKKERSQFFPNLGKYLFYPAFALAAIILIFSAFNKTDRNTDNKQTIKIKPSRFAHFQYLPQPQFKGTVSSSIAPSGEYRIKGKLPSAQELVDKSKLSFVPLVFAASPVNLPVYRVNHHEVTATDAAEFAEKFNISGEPKKDGTNGPAYYGFVWENEKEYFQVTGGSGTGSFEYYLKDPGLSGEAPIDEEARQIAQKFLTEKGIIDDSYFISGIQHNTSSISKRTGFEEDHKQVYFRKKLEGYQVYDWIAGGGSPTVDKLEVWIGVGGRILYVSYPSYWTTADLKNKTDYTLKEPNAVFEDLKAGRGKLAWLDYDAIGISTGGVGSTAPDGNFIQHGRLKDVEILSVDLAYYHQEESIDTPEFYQPIYLFKAQATLDWQDDYVVDYEADQFIQGKRTEVVLVASAISSDYFFNNNVTLTEGQGGHNFSQVPVYYPEKPKETGSFILKLGEVTPLKDPKRNVYLSWEDVKDTITYNIYLKPAGDKEFNQIGYVPGSKLSETISINKYIDYHIKVQACQATDCVDSNEIFLPQEQKPTFYLKLGTVTPGEDPKAEVYLSWAEYPGTMKYNVYLRNSQTESYQQALIGIGELSYTATINRHNDNYFIIQACNETACYPSNEVFLPRK